VKTGKLNKFIEPKEAKPEKQAAPSGKGRPRIKKDK
jgi:hypothetical protein